MRESNICPVAAVWTQVLSYLADGNDFTVPALRETKYLYRDPCNNVSAINLRHEYLINSLHSYYAIRGSNISVGKRIRFDQWISFYTKLLNLESLPS